MKTTSLVIVVFIFTQQCTRAADTTTCSSSGGLTFVCGVQNAEDLVLVPETHWVIASGMAPGGGIYLIDSVKKSSAQMYMNDEQHIRHDPKTYGDCPTAPKLESFVAHGLSIRAGQNGHSTLYVVGHGGREAIEVFDVDATRAKPLLNWIGCVPMPDGLAANSVASFRDGSLVATVLAHPGYTYTDVFQGKPTGAVYQWSPGDSGFELMRGTELPGNNGIEVSLDEQEIFVVSTGLSTISVFANSNPSKSLRTTRTLDFGPDNVHMTANGRLLTAGPSRDDHSCGALDPENVDLTEYVRCPRGFVAATIDPKTMEDSKLVSAHANPDFSNATMALQVGDEVWIGTFSGDRIGVAPGPR